MGWSDEIELFCSAGFSHPSAVAGSSRLVRISCGRFRSEDFECRKQPFHSARRRTDKRCFNNATFVDVGFEIGERFVIVLSLCHDELLQTTHYAQYRLTPGNVAAQRGVKRPSFIQSDFYPGKDVNALYGRERQRQIIGADALEDAGEEVVYLSRGNQFLFTQASFASLN
jgi:hypothetical protein